MTKEYGEGIYFGMCFEEYKNIKAVNRSYLEKLAEDVEEGWKVSPFNSQRAEQEDTPQMLLGRAVHEAVLEPDLFKKHYVTKPKKEDYLDKIILDKNNDFQNFLSEVGEKKSGTKKELINRVTPYINKERHIIWEDVLQKFENDVKENQKEVITDNDFSTIENILKRLNESKEIKKIFQDGHPEVTLIWKCKGTVCKARLDYVTISVIGELKTFSYRGKKGIYKAMCDEILYNKYNAQYAFYYNALSYLITEIRNNNAKVYGDVDKLWLEKFLENPLKQYFIVFVRTDSPYQMQAIELKPSAFDPGQLNAYYTEGENLMKKALKRHAKYTELSIGESIDNLKNIWRDSQEYFTLQDEDIPNIMYQNN